MKYKNSIDGEQYVTVVMFLHLQQNIPNKDWRTGLLVMSYAELELGKSDTPQKWWGSEWLPGRQSEQ